MSEMTEQEALDALRGIVGLRAAFIGFDHVISKVTPLIQMLSETRKSVASMESRMATLRSEIGELEEQKRVAAEAAAVEVQRLLDLREKVNQIAQGLK